MKLIRLMLVVFAIGFSATGNAATAIMPIDLLPCGSWVKYHTENSTDPAYSKLNLAGNNWVAGYLTGVVDGSGVDFLQGTNFDSIILWMNNYCNQNPLSQVSVGVMILVKELKARK
jgi:hypothetical protein